jgi:hypothetical protein
MARWKYDGRVQGGESLTAAEVVAQAGADAPLDEAVITTDILLAVGAAAVLTQGTGPFTVHLEGGHFAPDTGERSYITVSVEAPAVANDEPLVVPPVAKELPGGTGDEAAAAANPQDVPPEADRTQAEAMLAQANAELTAAETRDTAAKAAFEAEVTTETQAQAQEAAAQLVLAQEAVVTAEQALAALPA